MRRSAAGAARTDQCANRKFDDTESWIVAPKFNGEVRNPILFHRKLFPELLQLTGDRSGRPLLDKHKRKTALLDWSEKSLFRY
jgi:CTP:molybdopterin cytidylyltransferase MocA